MTIEIGPSFRANACDVTQKKQNSKNTSGNLQIYKFWFIKRSCRHECINIKSYRHECINIKYEILNLDTGSFWILSTVDFCIWIIKVRVKLYRLL